MRSYLKEAAFLGIFDVLPTSRREKKNSNWQRRCDTQSFTLQTLHFVGATPPPFSQKKYVVALLYNFLGIVSSVSTSLKCSNTAHLHLEVILLYLTLYSQSCQFVHQIHWAYQFVNLCSFYSGLILNAHQLVSNLFLSESGLCNIFHNIEIC